MNILQKLAYTYNLPMISSWTLTGLIVYQKCGPQIINKSHIECMTSRILAIWLLEFIKSGLRLLQKRLWVGRPNLIGMRWTKYKNYLLYISCEIILLTTQIHFLFIYWVYAFLSLSQGSLANDNSRSCRKILSMKAKWIKEYSLI